MIWYPIHPVKKSIEKSVFCLLANLTAKQSGKLSTVFDVGGIVGAILAGLVSDCTGCPGIVCVVFYMLCAPSVSITFLWIIGYMLMLKFDKRVRGVTHGEDNIIFYLNTQYRFV